MGMFDTIHYHHPIFGRDFGDNGQTKDLESMLNNFDIRSDGRMVLLPTGEDMNPHGIIRCFHLGEMDSSGQYPNCYNWVCKFTDGLLVDAYREYIEPRTSGQKFRDHCKEVIE